MYKKMIFMAAALVFLFTSAYSFAETEKTECSPEEIFQECDVDKDGKISKEEWNDIDTDKDDTITSEEWNKYRYKSTDQKTSPFQIKYFDVYGDGTMDKEEFLRNYRRLQ
jgi:Ca2+-binding EF-hand superfamily protein